MLYKCDVAQDDGQLAVQPVRENLRAQTQTVMRDISPSPGTVASVTCTALAKGVARASFPYTGPSEDAEA